MPLRTVAATLTGQAATDGAGVKLTRVIDPRQAKMFDPFLLLDEFRSDEASDYIEGFPPHPHRGFETVTYMMAGRMRHRDNKGHEGDLGPGSVQWMTAGRGIVHEEMPQQEQGLMWGYQLWVNLPASDKMTAPFYQDIPAEDIPEVDAGEGVRVRVVCGTFRGVDGPVKDRPTHPTYLDVTLPAGGALSWMPRAGHTVFVHGVTGTYRLGEESRVYHARQLALLGGEGDVLVRGGDEGGRVLIVSGKPLREQIAHYGPFVMNTREEVLQAVEDFQAGRF